MLTLKLPKGFVIIREAEKKSQATQTESNLNTRSKKTQTLVGEPNDPAKGQLADRKHRQKKKEALEKIKHQIQEKRIDVQRLIKRLQFLDPAFKLAAFCPKPYPESCRARKFGRRKEKRSKARDDDERNDRIMVSNRQSSSRYNERKEWDFAEAQRELDFLLTQEEGIRRLLEVKQPRVPLKKRSLS